MEQTTHLSSNMCLEIDPHGDTLITIMETDIKPLFPWNTGTVLPFEVPRIKQIREAAEWGHVFSV